MRGGAVVLGPLPRDYSYQMPKKMVKGALRSAISLRQQEAKLFVIKDWAPKAPKTKLAKTILAKFDATNTLVVGSREDETLRLSLRNLPHVKFLPVEGLNVFDILAFDNLIIVEGVVPGIVEKLKSAPSRTERALLEKAE